jgi:hypothetical protein
MQPQISAASQLDHDFPQYRGNAVLVLKFHVALHVALQILTFKFGPKIAPPMLTSKFHQMPPPQVDIKI